MQPPLLPLFPLQAVLFPRVPLPLHIFEERYKEMFGELTESKGEFGVVWAGEKGIASFGCTAVVDRVLERYGDGRLDLATSGRRRFEIQKLDNERTFLRGEVEFFDDEDPDAVPPADRKRAVDGWKELTSIEGAGHEPRWEDPQLSFQLAEGIPDLEFRQTLLAIRSESRRMRELAEFFPAYVSRQRHAQHVQTVAPRNGHGKRVVADE